MSTVHNAGVVGPTGAHDAGAPAARSARLRWAACIAVLIAACAGCGAAGASSPAPAGASPSKSARMVCAREAQKELADALGATTTAAVVPTWVDHRYSCVYPYASGTITLSVKELDDAAATTAWFAAAQAALGAGAVVPGLGQGAFQGTDGSLIVRKDFKVLDVDVSSLPAQFGTPPIPRAEAAVRVAIVVMGCWTGG